jgi:HSP20 family protein
MAREKKRPPLWFEGTDPFEPMRRMESDFHRIMAEMWSKPAEIRIPEMRMRLPTELSHMIPVQMAQTEKELLLRAELPGFQKDEVKLKVTPTSVDIAATKKKQRIEQTEKVFRRDSAFSSTRRTLTLPTEVLTEGVRAKFENGMLEIIMPKKEAKKREAREITPD